MWTENLTREEMELGNALFAASGRRSVELGGSRYRVRYLPGFFEPSEPYLPAFSLPLAVGGRRMVLDLDRVPDAAALSAALDPSGRETAGRVPSRLPPELLGAWIESRLEKLLDAAEAELGQEITLDPPGAGSRPPAGESPRILHIRLDGEAGAASLRARLFHAREDLPALAGWLSPPAAGAAGSAGPLAEDDTMPVRLHFRLGGLRLGLGEFRGLVPGDILLAEEEHAGDRRVRITTGGRRQASCRAIWKGSGLIVEERMTMETGAQEPPAPARGWDDLEVEIAFDLGERTLSLREARGLQPGMVLPLPSNPEGQVRIRVNGKVVGTGALLKVDGQVGVRILSLPGGPAAAERSPASAGAA